MQYYNSCLQGFVSAQCLAKEPVEHPADMFYIGQSVTCRILSCDAERDKMALTFVLDGEPSQGTKRKAGKDGPVESKRYKEESGAGLNHGQVLDVCM